MHSSCLPSRMSDVHWKRRIATDKVRLSPRAHSRMYKATVCTATMPTTEVVTAQRPAARRKEDLNDPAHILARGQAQGACMGYPGLVSLTQYMTLPVEQYFVLDPKQIQHLGGDRFLLLVPRIQIFNMWLEPEVEISVKTVLPDPLEGDIQQPMVILQAENCRIRGSEAIEKLRIDQRFCMKFTTHLTWSDPAQKSDGTLTEATSDSCDEAAGMAAAAAELSGVLGTVGQGQIQGDATLDVWCEVIQPFHLMPRSALQATCNTVLSGVMGTLLPLFVRKLAADYGKWATEPEYRAQRAARSQPLE